MTGRVSDAIASRIAGAFSAWHTEFRGMTRRARGRFARREWQGGQEDAASRLASYQQWVERFVATLGVLPPNPRAHWSRVRDAFGAEFAASQDADLAGTFFNSVTRRILGTVGSDPNAEFTHSLAAHAEPEVPVFRSLAVERLDAGFIRRIVQHYPLGADWEDLGRDAALAARAIGDQLRDLHGCTTPGGATAELLPGVFYRNKGAYVVGRLRLPGAVVPLLLALTHEAHGMAIDAVLLSPDETSAVFGFTRSYFHADLEQPAPVIEFLASIMPLKREDELWTAIGYHKHGKTVFYRTLMCHLAEPGACFEFTEGDRGMVMSVFTLPSLNVVFKIIKDRFDQPKAVTRDQVIARYNLVFAHDRVGRLADAQEFDHLRLSTHHFQPDLLAELRRVAAATVSVQGDDVIIRHCYTERRVTPLNLFLRGAHPAQTIDAIVDYGDAVRDLAAANIFPGDMLLKNFGVTRHGRVIFYDYDELCLLTDCHVRRLPSAATHEDEMSAETWFAVREGDIFPEEFRHFVMLPGVLGETFLLRHGDLFKPAFWIAMQDRQRAGEVVDFFPYPASRRLRPRLQDGAAHGETQPRPPA
jgi:isocitrate dehydrogenase kinase/phosphatase